MSLERLSAPQIGHLKSLCEEWRDRLMVAVVPEWVSALIKEVEESRSSSLPDLDGLRRAVEDLENPDRGEGWNDLGRLMKIAVEAKVLVSGTSAVDPWNYDMESAPFGEWLPVAWEDSMGVHVREGFRRSWGWEFREFSEQVPVFAWTKKPAPALPGKDEGVTNA